MNRVQHLPSRHLLVAWILCILFLCETSVAEDPVDILLMFDSSSTEQAPADSSKDSNIAPPSESATPTVAIPVAVTDSLMSADSLNTAPQDPVDLKSVLYLGGGENSPWFHLGVLYAIEEYKFPVDSIVATSWGSWIGALWAKGVQLDEIQRLMQDSAIAPYVGKILKNAHDSDSLELQISMTGVPSIRQRFTLSADSSGNVVREKRSLHIDSLALRHMLGRLRFQEILYRQKETYEIPFNVQACDGSVVGSTINDIIATMQLWPNESTRNMLSGEVCPRHAYPLEDARHIFSIISVADPLRSKPSTDPLERLLHERAEDNLKNQPGAVIRPHIANDTSHCYWIQLGFTSVENHLKELKSLSRRPMDYNQRFGSRIPLAPLHAFAPAFDSLSSEILAPIKTHWPEQDTGLTAPKIFAEELERLPHYNSVSLDMQAPGELMVYAAVRPTFDVAVGGFGSNALGANAYFETSVSYVNQMEINLALAGFYGTSSYGVMPRLEIARLWNKHWSASFGYDYLKLSPLKSFNNEQRADLRITNEERNDFLVSLHYDFDKMQRLSADFLFGNRSFLLDSLFYGTKPVETYPVSPSLRYEFLLGENDPWFSTKGISATITGGLESIGFEFGTNDLIPIYWKLAADLRYTFSPKPFASLTFAASGGIERYHEEGYGYVYPKAFDYRPLDVAYRMHAAATPWSMEWYNSELSSHEYGLLRATAGLHNKHFGAWLTAAYYHDFEGAPFAELGKNKWVLEPALRYVYRSFEIYTGMNQIAGDDNLRDLKKFKNYTYFIKIGRVSF